MLVSIWVSGHVRHMYKRASISSIDSMEVCAMIKEQLHDVCLTIRSSNDESCVVHKDFPCVDKSASVSGHPR